MNSLTYITWMCFLIAAVYEVGGRRASAWWFTGLAAASVVANGFILFFR